MKKFLVFLGIVMLAVFMICAATAETEGEWTYEITSEGLVITSYTGTDTNVTIPDEINGYKVSVIGKAAFADNTVLSQITIPKGINAIKAQAFYGCSGLSVIWFNAKNCSVPDVYIHDGNKGAGVFSGAGSASPSGLKVVFGDTVAKIPDKLFETASYSEGYGRTGCPYAYVTEVVISDSVKEIGYSAFANCRELAGVQFGRKIQTVGDYAFYGCVSLPELVLNEDLVSIGKYAFWGNTSLAGITWGENLGTIGEGAFANCSSLKKVELVSPLVTIEKAAFRDCIGLKEILIPETVTSIRAEAFCGCSKLALISFNAKNCSIPDVYIHDGNKGAGVFSGAGSASPTGLKAVFGDTVAKVPDKLFETASYSEGYGRTGCPYAYVTEVVISDSVKEIGYSAFSNCRELTDVQFGRKIQNIGDYAFYGCVSLPELVFNEDLVTIGKCAFSSNTSLDSIAWGGNLSTIRECAFENCSSLKKVEFVSPLVTIGTGAFRNCIGLKEILIPETVTSVNAEAFRGCVGLSLINFNAKDCWVPEIYLHDGNKGAGVFSGAGSASPTGLKAVFGSSVSKVPDRLFETASYSEGYGRTGCPYAYVTEIFIPANVREIGSSAFANCRSLVLVVFEGADPVISDSALNGCSNDELVVSGPAESTAAVFAGSKGIRFTEISAAGISRESTETPAVSDGKTETGSDAGEADGTWTCANGHAGNIYDFCPICGLRKPEARTCANCGFEFPDDLEAAFCPKCGTPIN